MNDGRAWAVALILFLLIAGGGFLLLNGFNYTPAASRTALTTASVTSGINGMLDLYKLHVGHYPTNLADLAQRPANPTDAAKWRGPYVKSAPKALHDAWGNPLHYRYPSTRNTNTYDLWSTGPDGVSGTADDITNPIVAAPQSQPSSAPANTPSATRPSNPEPEAVSPE